jgi:RNA polymerase sigma factor (sigma-70 family)
VRVAAAGRPGGGANAAAQPARSQARSRQGGVQAAVAAAFREEAGGVTAALMRQFSDFDLAEECAQEAVLVALQRWPRDGVPRRPGAWLLTVARRRALNRIARDATYRSKLGLMEAQRSQEADDRLRLIFTCCHPALPRDGQVALTLRAVCGFTTPEIARAFVVSEPAVAQRIVRARRKITAAGIPYRIPAAAELAERLSEVAAVLYLMFNEGHLSTAGGMPEHRALAEDATWLAGLLCRLLPSEPEPLGLLALMKLHLARAETRFDAGGEMVLLHDQDRSRWDRSLIEQGIGLIERAAAMRRPGPYQVEAAIAACHAEAASFQATDWAQIMALYEILLQLSPSPIVRLNRAIALHRLEGPQAALHELESLAGQLSGYHLFHSARGAVLTELGRPEEARAAQVTALRLTQNPAERSLLEKRLFT